MRTIAARRNAQIALPTMPWRTVVPRETHPRPTVTRARTDHPRLAPALGHRRHAATVCTRHRQSSNASPGALCTRECTRRCVGGPVLVTFLEDEFPNIAAAFMEVDFAS